MRTPEDPCRDPASEARDDHASEPTATPETDAFYARLYHPETPDEMVEGASGQERRMMQRLERQRDELLEALEMVETYLIERGIESRGTTGRTLVLPRIRAAIAAVKGGRDE
jgi:hypothetical protein